VTLPQPALVFLCLTSLGKDGDVALNATVTTTLCNGDNEGCNHDGDDYDHDDNHD